MYRAMAMAMAMACGCATGPSACGHADETTYRCMPLLANARGCVGAPRGAAMSSGRVYPIGCQVDVPECSELDPGMPRTFECVLDAGGEPDWYEPI
jgi:hypothetical protein